ncbi:unnamed protein product [Euphydryas editha]|uniref:Uncharacterized protein n=2 Tax=Euphydryas editha TaxID=104508 RepID=A0AAU9U0U0_EUPED|nr:unnamed protein product [Euphydryas editha]
MVVPSEATDKAGCSIRFIQVNLQRSKLATAELLQVASEKGISIALVQEPYIGRTGEMRKYPGAKIIQCTLSRQKSVKAAIIVFGDSLEVIHDPQIVTENVAAVFVKAGQLRLGLMSVYFEGDQDMEAYLQQLRVATQKIPTQHLLVAGDVNAWSHWWGSSSENHRGAQLHGFISEMDLQILNRGQTPTFETYRGDRLYSSCIDVTLTSQSLLAKMENWKVERNLITSDHNAITFALRVEGPLKPLQPISTRRYNTKKARWADFTTILKSGLAEQDVTLSSVSNVSNGEELEEMLTRYTTVIHGACETTIPRIKPWKGDPRPPWWSAELHSLKRELLKTKRRIRNAAPSRRASVVEEYILARDKYKMAASEAATQSWKEFCTAQDRESVWDGIYRVIRKTSRRQDDMLLRSAAGETLTPDQSAELLAKTFYPDDCVTTDTAYHKQVREAVDCRTPAELQDLSDDDPPFTTAELEMVLSSQNPKKAPGPDGLTSDICAAAINCDKAVFLALANKCLSLSYFPKQWKVAHICILRKPAKEDYTHPKSYRPIGLLSILGKTVEKLLIGRLQWRLFPTLHRSQYGFMPQKGTEDALYDLVAHIRREIKLKKIVLLVSLDIEGAFDNAWWPALKKQLVEKHCPKNLYSMVASYLKDRKVIVNYARATSEKETTKGCVQGSIGGPTFWNLILDSLLREVNDMGVYCQAFADDVVLVFSSHKTSDVQVSAETTLATVQDWGNRNKLSFAAHKTKAMVMTRKLKYDTPIVRMSGTQLRLVEEIKLLGLIIDSKLTFNAHVSAICKKAADIYKQLACAARVSWGLNGEIVRTIYVAVIEPIVLYAASAWSPAAEKLSIRKRLDSLQRGFAQKICKAYRTVSLTSALVLSGLLPLDLRIREAAMLYKTKKGHCEDLLLPGSELERRVGPLQNPHPSQLKTTEYECLLNLNPETLEKHHIDGPLIYTDGSKIEGKVGAALTWWDQGREARYSTFRLEPHNTVFQSEMYALFRAVDMVRKSKESSINILSDSRSSLDLLKSPLATHPLAMEMKRCIRQIQEENRSVRFFWLKAHVGIPGNERADELAKKAALTKKSAPDYNKVPISYVRRQIREETVRLWQDRYNSSQTGSVTKIFLPDAKTACKLVRKVTLTPVDTQILTGHGGFAAYLHRFHLKDSPSCVCDPNCEETVLHIVLECPRFGKGRLDLEIKLQRKLDQPSLHTIMENEADRTSFLAFARHAVVIAARRNGSTALPPAPLSVPQAQSTITATPHLHPTQNSNTQTGSAAPLQESPTRVSLGLRLQAIPSALRKLFQGRTTQNTPPPPTQSKTLESLLREGNGSGEVGIRTRCVALFMDSEAERIGISFCRSEGLDRLVVSPGLALLIKGSTQKTNLKRKKIDALAQKQDDDSTYRLVRLNNKAIALFEWGEESAFAQASSWLQRQSELPGATPGRISVDSMRVGYDKGDVADRYGCLMASKIHEVIVYEDRGEDLGYLKDQIRTPSPPKRPALEETMLSGSERLQAKVEAQRAELESRTSRDGNSSSKSRLTAIATVIQATISPKRGTRLSHLAPKSASPVERQSGALRRFMRDESPKLPQVPPANRTRADKGQVTPPMLRPASTPQQHAENAYIEFLAITKANRQVSLAICEKIMQTYQYGHEGLLEVELNEAEAAIYNNDTCQVIKGNMSGLYMAAYNTTAGFVDAVEAEGPKEGPQTFNTPKGDPVVVVARCTRVMLGDRIIEMSKTITSGPEVGDVFGAWELPALKWINGVPGCGKTTHIVGNFDEDGEIVATTTLEAAKDLKEKLAHRYGKKAKSKVRTMASILVNGFHESIKINRLTVDEALMNHFGAIVMAARLSEAKEVVLVGDINQLPYIDRDNLFIMRYCRPNMTIHITCELSCTHRNPKDVALAINEVYKNIYSSNPIVRSLRMERFTGTRIPERQDGTLYLVFTQEEKKTLLSQGYGTGRGSSVMTIHEAQGQTREGVIIIQTKTRRLRIHDSIPHAVVAVTRHTKTCVYYTDDGGDAIGRFVQRAVEATSKEILEHTLRMAIQKRDTAVIEDVLGQLRSPSGRAGTESDK